MLKFYTNKDLSQALGINLAKWKRWSRDFLAPDPLGGLQSGYARQYNPDEAFTVFLGGYLVSGLKFTIPEAKQILQDLHAWLVKYGFYFGISDTTRPAINATHAVKRFIIRIFPQKAQDNVNFSFSYEIHGIVAEKEILYKDHPANEVLSLEWRIGVPITDADRNDWLVGRMININELRTRFLNCLQATNQTS